MNKFLFASIMMLMPALMWAQPQVVAHRGYWKTEGSAQNSVTAMELAGKHKLYGSEVDIWLTSDGVLVCNHDHKVQGHVIQDTPFSTVQYIKMSNGECIPTFAHFLREAKRFPELRLVVEIKTHNSDERNIAVTDATVNMIRDMKMQHQVEYIAFSMQVCKRLHELEPQAKVAYLTGDIEPAKIKEIGLTGIDYNEGVFKKNPTWAQEAHELGLEVNVWTVDGEENLLAHAINPYFDLITTNDPIVLQNILKGKKGKKSKKSKK